MARRNGEFAEGALITGTKYPLRAHVCLRKNRGISWHSFSEPGLQAWAKGFAFYDGALFRAEELGQLLIQTVKVAFENERLQRLEALLRGLNGHFALVLQTDDLLFAAVDRVRSIPLFYGQHDDQLCVSDDAFWVKEQVDDRVPDPLSVREFLFTGYVTGRDTLFPNVKQLQAGECILFENSPEDIRMILRRYYRFTHSDLYQLTEDEWCEQLDHVLLGVFSRLLESAEGRQIAVPLSGGWDSRLIVSMLKRLDATNVLTFSYGRPGNLESSISQTVAQTLGFTWEFVPYSPKQWREWASSQHWTDYLEYGGQYCALAHIQDFPAVWELNRLRKLEADAVFVPGHTADVISGSHLPLSLESCSSFDCKLIMRVLLARHYNLWGRNDPLLLSALERRIEATGIKDPIMDLEQAASLVEMWEWQERQAKFIVNAVRAYEFWGFEWRVPFWDAEFMDLWSHVPCSLRFVQRLYSRYVGRVFKATGLSGIPSMHSRQTRGSIRSDMKRVILDCMRTRSSIGDLLRRAAFIASYWTHPLAWYGINSFRDHLKQALHRDALDASFSINSILVKHELARWGIECADAL